MEEGVSAQHPDWIPLTKVTPPQVGDDILPRASLLNQLFQAVTNNRLTLISAPAGSGKTVAAASLSQTFADFPVVWLALDEDDNDPITFMWLLAVALQGCFPDCGAKAMALLADLLPPAPEIQRVMGVLINEVLRVQPPPFAFVLDDYHLIDNPSIHAVVGYLLEHLPPPWHVVIATREDPPLPLARLRARGQLAAFDLADLRFQKEDVQALFQERLSLQLPLELIETLHQRTEGWIAGLRLLASTLQTIASDESRRVFIEQFASADRHVFDLLAEEVLHSQPVELQAFLLETSILHELTATLCQAVTGRADAAQLLAKAVRSNLFLSTVGEFETRASPVYRYHHLFAQFLRHCLAETQPDRIKELHRRAAGVETTPARALHHYVAAEAWEQAAATIEAYGSQMLMDSQVFRLRTWIEALPRDLRAQRAWLNYLLGMSYAHGGGDFATAQPLLKTALAQFREEGDGSGETAALLGLFYVAGGLHDFASVAILLEQLLERTLSPYEQVFAHMGRAWLMVYQNNWSQIDADISAAIQIALASEDPKALGVLARHLTPALVFGKQGIDPIEKYHKGILASLDETASVDRAGTLGVLSAIRWLRGDIADAVDKAREARRISQQFGGLVWMDMAWDLVLLGEAQMRGDYPTLKRRWQARAPNYEETGARQWLVVYFYIYGRALWMQGRGEALRALARRAEATAINFEPPESLIARQMIAALLSLHEGDFKRAETILLQAVALQQQFRHVRIFFDARFILAHLYLELERLQDALALLRPLLTTLAQDASPGLILWEGPYVIPLLHLAVERHVQAAFAKEVLALFERNQTGRPLPITGTGETLTPREVDVLRLLMTGATNKEIAEQLVITPRTAKAHVSNILHKLGVSTRTEAVARAHELSLLSG